MSLYDKNCRSKSHIFTVGINAKLIKKLLSLGPKMTNFPSINDLNMRNY